MKYSNWDIFKMIMRSEKKDGRSFSFCDEEENFCCGRFWCYNVKKINIKLSELKPAYKPNINRKKYKKITDEIKEFGFDYSKGYITIQPNSENIIGDGHHRYFILKNIYGMDYEIVVFKFLDQYNILGHLFFIYFFMKPIKIFYDTLRLINRVFSK